jgi:hypothetical protein
VREFLAASRSPRDLTEYFNGASNHSGPSKGWTKAASSPLEKNPASRPESQRIAFVGLRVNASTFSKQYFEPHILAPFIGSKQFCANAKSQCLPKTMDFQEVIDTTQHLL